MKISAIIAEYNPFHNGHLKQIQEVRRIQNPDILVVVMSQSFTQHGDICLADSKTRANWALKASADLVISLPTVYTISSAPIFAYGSLKTLSIFGDYTLNFGTEADDISSLIEIAKLFKEEPIDLSNLIKENLKKGNSLAKSKELAINELYPQYRELIVKPNNILAIEYIKESFNYKNVQLNAIKRFENRNSIASSSIIRENLSKHISYSNFVPNYINSDTFIDTNKYYNLAIYSILEKSNNELNSLLNFNEGLENYIKKANINTIEDYLNLTNKRLTKSTLKRALISSFIDAKKEHLELAINELPYASILAINESKKVEILKNFKSNHNLFLTPNECREDNPIKPLMDLDLKAEKLLNFCK